MVRNARSILGDSGWLSAALVAVLLIMGLGIRMYDFTDLPLDFHPTRQMLSELKARGMYFQAHPELPDWERRTAVRQWKLRAEVEPEIFERLVAVTYNFTGVETWVARIYASLFWTIGGVFLYLLIRAQASHAAAVLGLCYFLFHPYSIAASRAFQPDVPMVLLIVLFWWAYFRWTGRESWAWAVLAGLAGGVAILVKFVAAFFVIGAAAGLGFGTFGWKLLRKLQFWAIATLGALPAGLYLYYGVVESGFLGRQFSGRFIPGLLLDPRNYVQWAAMVDLAAGGVAVAFGLLGLLLARKPALKTMLLGLWIAYILFGVFFDYHVATHDYYHLPLIAMIALSAAPVSDLVMRSVMSASEGLWREMAVLGILLYAVFSGIWAARTQMASVDFRPQAALWREIGDRLGHGPNVVALTEDYGSRLAYWGWQNAIVWPNSADIDYRRVRGGSVEFEETYENLARGNAYFLVTDFEELQRQPALRDRLDSLEVFAEGAGYVIYDLQAPRGP